MATTRHTEASSATPHQAPLLAGRNRNSSSSARAGGAALLVAIVLGACGGTNTAGDTGEQDVITTNHGASTPEDAADENTGGTDDTVTTAPEEPNETDLGAVLLTTDDLPDGWTEVPVDHSGGDSCIDDLAEPGAPFDPAVTQSVAFGAGPIGPFLVAVVVDQPAEVVLPAVDDILIACHGTTSAQGYTTTIDSASIAGLPQGSLGVHTTIKKGEGGGIRHAIAVAGTDTATVMVMAITPMGEIDETAVAAAVNAMYNRLPRS